MKKIVLAIIVTFSTTHISFGQKALDYSGNPKSSSDSIKLKTLNHYNKSSKNAASIVNVIPSPIQTTFMNDIAFDGQYLWVQGVNEFLLHQISTINGSIVKSIPTTVAEPYGLTFDGNFLWLSDYYNRVIQKIDTANGVVLQSFPTPAISNNSRPGGLAWDGQDLWHNDMMGINHSTYNIDTSGQIIQSFPTHGTYNHGLTWDGQYLWSSDNPNQEIYKIDVSSFSVLDTIDAPGGLYPNGLAFDGQYLWVANNDADSIYQIDIGHIPIGISNLNQVQIDFTVYPNPTSNQLTIIDNHLTKYNIDIITITGKTVMSFQQNIGTVNVADLPKGVYFIQLVSDGMRMSKKFIKK